MTFKLELNSVDPGWPLAANAPDGVSFSLQADDQTISTHEWLHHFLQLYEAVRLRDPVTNIQFAVVELDQTIDIVYRNFSETMACSTTYEEGLTEVTEFLETVFRQLDTTSDDGEREDIAPWLNSWLYELTLAEVYAEVTAP